MKSLKLVGRFQRLLALFSVGILLLGSAAIAQAPRPFRISGGGVAPNGLIPAVGPKSVHLARGEATHLGRYQGSGALELYTLDLLTLSGTFGSAEPFTFIAANGDKLVTQYGNKTLGASKPGTYQLTVLAVIPPSVPEENPTFIVSAVFVAEFVVQPRESTGRFAGATGKWVMEARTAPFVLGSTTPLPYVWQGQGTISMPRR